jgi:hypothetical protein
VILDLAVIALLGSSAVIALLVVGAAAAALPILRRWDLASGSELQVRLERRTYLVSTLVACALAFQAVSLFLFLHTADRLSGLLVGAMCSAGTLNANPWGYPALLLKCASFVAGGVWLVLNRVDNRAPDYPLLRVKYAALLALAPLVLAENAVQAAFLAGLEPDLITSCCGTIFSGEGRSLAGGLAALPPKPMRLVFFASAAAVLGIGAYALRRGRGFVLYAAASAAMLAVGTAALVSFISVYIYELPTHHCPFCVLQRDYHSIGYPLFLSLFGGGIFGLSAGALALAGRRTHSLAAILPGALRRLVGASCAFYAAFAAIALWALLSADFTL